MKCPKCKKEMEKYWYGNAFGNVERIICKNKTCHWYGIYRYTGKEK